MRAALLGMACNGVLALVKAVAGILGNSYALIADAVESFSDIASSLVVYGGLRISSRPPDSDHPYGHGKAEPLAALVVSLALLAAAAGIAIESAREIVTPHHPPAAFTLVVLVVVIVVKESLARYVSGVGAAVGSRAAEADAWHHRSDALTSAFAFGGIGIALWKGPGYESADDWAALAASAVIAFNAARLARPAIREIMDTAPPPEIEESIRDIARSIDGVRNVEKCFVRKMGLQYYADLHLGVSGEITVREGHELAHRVKDAIRSRDPRISDVLIHVEPSPDLRSRSPESDPSQK